MNKILIPVFAAGLLFTACNKEKTDNTAAEVIADSVTHAVYPEDTLQVFPQGDTTQNSVDWNGVYTGKLPCASCPGVETVLTLKSDNTYTLAEQYLEEKDGNFSSTGTFSFDESGSFIILNNPKDKTEKRVFFVGEGKAWMVQNVGDRNFRNDYELTKQP